MGTLLNLDDLTECHPSAQAELLVLRKDAERYRWLRDAASVGDWDHIGHTTTPNTTDACIDECMADIKAVGAA